MSDASPRASLKRDYETAIGGEIEESVEEPIVEPDEPITLDLVGSPAGRMYRSPVLR